jgi:hypothetical protein
MRFCLSVRELATWSSKSFLKSPASFMFVRVSSERSGKTPSSLNALAMEEKRFGFGAPVSFLDLGASPLTSDSSLPTLSD